MTTQSELTKSHIGRYSHIDPLPDPPEEREMQQFDGIYAFAAALRLHFANRRDVLISGSGYLCQNAGDIGNLVPDCMFVEGVSDPEAIVWRNGYVISEVGKPPDFVLEVGARSAGRRDYTVKREGYASYGVREYWCFDPSGGEYHDAPLAGDVLIDGEYAPIEIASEPNERRWGYSEALGLELWWEAKSLRFRNPATGEFILMPEEFGAAIESARSARDFAEERADAERIARESAEARLAEMEDELRRLRGEA